MGGKKTRDGIKISSIEKVISEIDGMCMTPGRKHDIKIHFPGMRACPVDTSTDARKMLTPWIVKATGYSSQDVYQCLREGQWYQ